MPPVRAVFAVSALIVSSGSLGQDMMRHVDLASPEMTQAEVTRADVEILIQNGAPVDLSNRRLSGLDLSDLNLKAANLQASRLNKTNLSRADLSGPSWIRPGRLEVICPKPS
jgi:uncharacterized protein YjbI with pentapeptide repeats